MKLIIKKANLFLLLFLLIPCLSAAAINFTNGKWETTFDCNDWSQGAILSCDGFEPYGGWTCNDSQGAHSTEIISSANNPNGPGGKGLRNWYAAPKNNVSGGTTIAFPSAQPELWVRWYQKANPGLISGLAQGETKTLYFRDSAGNAMTFGMIGSDQWRYWVVANDTGQITPVSSSGYGWKSLISQQNWELVEVYVKADTNNGNGILRAWVNGNLVLNVTNVDNAVSSRGGWTKILFPSNHELFGNSLCGALDYDDVTIYNSTPPNKDSNNYAFIGPLEGVTTPPPPAETTPPPPAETTPPPPAGTSQSATVLFEESFDDGNLIDRGWYDNTNPVLSSSETISSSGKSAEYTFVSGATTPTSGGSMRKKITETDSVYVSYYVKYSANWQGSNKAYHPHEFYLLTNQDTDWTGMAYTHLTAYIEQNEFRPQLAIADGRNVDISNLNKNMVGVTENRSVAGCNGDSDGYGDGSCYPVGSQYWNWKQWQYNGTAITAGTWHKVEAYLKLNSVGATDGVLQYWLDGQLLIDHNDVVFRTGQYPNMKFNQLIIAPWIGDGSPITQTFWIDNLRVATAPLDVAPTAPKSLRIIAQ